MKRTNGEKIFDMINIAVMIAFMLLVIIPLLNVVSISLTSTEDLVSTKFPLIPSKVDWGAYSLVFASGSTILNSFKISVIRVVFGTLLNMILTYFLAYAMALRKLPGRTGITLFVFGTMMFSGGLIPSYLLINYAGLMNNFLVFIIPGAVSAWYTLLMRNFIMNVPDSLFEAAEIDGARELTVIFRVILPLSLPAMATITLFYAVGHWNSWWDAYLYVRDPSIQPIQLMLRNILASTQISVSMMNNRAGMLSFLPPSRAIQNAVVVVSTIPILCVYPFLQKYFVKGIMVGSIKG